jgi:ligand-binding SRPBCC domain-containing protein
VKLSFEHTFDVAAADLFAFHENPENLILFLRGWPTFRMVRNDGHIRTGSITLVQERAGPLWIPMTFEHFVYEPPHRFGERQVRGPFKKLEHVHEFESTGSGTILRDLVDVVLPWYLGGSLATRLFIAPKFRRFFAFRHAEMERLLKAGTLF